MGREKNIQLNLESEPDRIQKDKYGVRDNISKTGGNGGREMKCGQKGREIPIH